MSDQKPPEQRIEANDPLGMSRFSIRRYSIQHFILMVLVNVLLATLTVAAVRWGNSVLVVLSATSMVVVWIKTVLVIWVGMRTVEVEIWTRRLGMGDFDYRIEPRGNDEISKACEALETLRLRSIEVVRLQLVERLSSELSAANADLEARNLELDRTLSQLREAQDQLVAQQKLREMVDLASGVAHEIRNPLNFVANFTDGSAELLDELMEALSRDEQDDSEIEGISNEIRTNMDYIRRNLGRADRVIQGMIDLGSVKGVWQEVSLNVLVRQAVRAAEDAYIATDGGGKPHVEVREDPADPRCLAVPEGLALAIMCLVQNSFEAVAAGERPDAPITVSIEDAGDRMDVIVKDEGCGMTPEVLRNVMTPFYTTRQGDNKGAGLGLPQAAEVARAHGGNVEISSTPGKGTTVTLTLSKRPSPSNTEEPVS
jgi:signal transduction histidine kinase